MSAIMIIIYSFHLHPNELMVIKSSTINLKTGLRKTAPANIVTVTPLSIVFQKSTSCPAIITKKAEAKTPPKYR